MAVTDTNILVSENPDHGTEVKEAQHLSEHFHCPFVDLREQTIDAKLLHSVPADLMFRYHFVPLEAHDKTLTIAIADPSNFPVNDEIALLLDKRIQIAVATASQITDFLKRTEQSQRFLADATEGFTHQEVREDEDPVEIISMENLTAESGGSPVVRLLDTIIFTALQRRASDIHIETGNSAVDVRYRIDGVLELAMQPLAKDVHTTLISRIKVMSELDITESRIPQDGRFRVRYNDRLVDFRISIMPSVYGEDAVLRILDKETLSEKFRDLSLGIVGFDSEELTRFRGYIRQPYGMVLITGPTGSGKTTTLYAAINEIKSVQDKIITIEDPVEYQLSGITQVPVNEKKGLTFARGLRSILRHDPDKIMVGEIRDQETAVIAINSALTGHLVFTTVHANNTTDVIGRFINMGVEPYNFVSAVNCIMAQRLVRVLCEKCKIRVSYLPEVLSKSGLDPKEWASVPMYEGAGCLECSGSGFHGRSAISELLDFSDRIREMIINRRPSSEIKRTTHEDGMTSLRDSGLKRVRAGLTTLGEVNRVTFHGQS